MVGMLRVLYLRRSIECVDVEVKRALHAPLDSEIIDCGELSICIDSFIHSFIHPSFDYSNICTGM